MYGKYINKSSNNIVIQTLKDVKVGQKLKVILEVKSVGHFMLSSRAVISGTTYT